MKYVTYSYLFSGLENAVVLLAGRTYGEDDQTIHGFKDVV